MHYYNITNLITDIIEHDIILHTAVYYSGHNHHYNMKGYS